MGVGVEVGWPKAEVGVEAGWPKADEEVLVED